MHCFVILTTAALIAAVCASTSCYNDTGAIIDQWAAIKRHDSYSYIYADATNWTLALSPYMMNGTASGALASTVQQLWESGIQYIAYNDEVGGLLGTVDHEPGHLKGIIAFNASDNTGFWLSHSVPSFPSDPRVVPAYDGLPATAEIYAQDFFCVSMNTTELEALAAMLLLDSITIIAKNISANTTTAYPNIYLLSEGKYLEDPVCLNASIHGVTVFAKTGEWDLDLWSSCVAPAYEDEFLVETWIRGDAVGPSCPPEFNYTTLDVTGLDFGIADFAWDETDDHSKWGVAATLPIICFGDINRMTTQFAEGGGAACIENEDLASQFRAAIISHNTCP